MGISITSQEPALLRVVRLQTTAQTVQAPQCSLLLSHRRSHGSCWQLCAREHLHQAQLGGVCLQQVLLQTGWVVHHHQMVTSLTLTAHCLPRDSCTDLSRKQSVVYPKTRQRLRQGPSCSLKIHKEQLLCPPPQEQH
jgi:hypothetical protein